MKLSIFLSFIFFSGILKAATMQEARKLRDEGRPRAALDVYHDLLKQDPQNLEAARELAWTESADLGRHRKALQILEPWLQKFPQDESLLLQFAEITSWRSNLRESLRLYRKAIERHPRSTDARAGQAQVLMWLGRAQEAESQLRETIRDFPEAEKPRVRLAELLVSQERNREAREVLETLKRPDALKMLEPLQKTRLAAIAGKSENNYEETVDSLGIRAARRFHPDSETSLLVERSYFTQENTASVTSDRYLLGSTYHWGQVRGRVSAGVDDFQNIQTAPVLFADATTSAIRDSVLSVEFLRENVRANARSIASKVHVTRWGPNLSASLSDHDSIFGFIRQGFFSDTNRETQTFLKLEHRFETLKLGIARFEWSFEKDPGSGYFAPDRLTTSNLEGNWGHSFPRNWRGDLFFAVGQEEFQGVNKPTRSYSVEIRKKISEVFSASGKWQESNVRDLSAGGDAFNRQSLTVELNYSM